MPSKSLPKILAQNPALQKAAIAAHNQVQTVAGSAPAGKRATVQREADKLRQAIAEARVIQIKGGER